MGTVEWMFLIPAFALGASYGLWRGEKRLKRYEKSLERYFIDLTSYVDERLRTSPSTKPLTQTASKAQDKPQRPLSGAELRRLSERMNVTVPEPTQAERLETNG